MAHGRCRRCGGTGWVPSSFGKKKSRCPGDYAPLETKPLPSRYTQPGAVGVSEWAGNQTAQNWSECYEGFQARFADRVPTSSTGVDGVQTEPLTFADFGYLERGDGEWTSVYDEVTGVTRIRSVVDSGPGYFEATVSGTDQKLHSTDGSPAYQYYDPNRGGVVKYSFKNGYLHGSNGNPSTVYPNGTMEWRKGGKLHRDDGGPATIRPDGGKSYYHNGNRTMDVSANGDTRSYDGGYPARLHRTDGYPAIALANGHSEWWVKGRRHRLDGPAVVYPNGKKEYWVKGKKVSRIRFLLITKVAPFTRSRLLRSLIPRDQGENEDRTLFLYGTG